MRVKTDERRRAILRAASELFHDRGFDRTSMAAISTSLGGSKGTLYSYFRSKEELFAAVMVEAIDERGYALLERLEGGGGFRERLEDFGEAYLTFVAEPDVVACNRTAISAAMTSCLGASLYDVGPRRFWQEVATILAHRIASGDLVEMPLADITAHLRSLLEADYCEPLLFGATPSLTPRNAAMRAIDAFLRLYAPTA